MDPESKKFLEETFALAEENNRMLRSIRRSMRMSQIMSFLYWVVIIGSAVGAYYFIHPYLDQILKMYGSANAVLQNFKP